MQLSAHFTLDELTRSAKAAQLRIDNTAPQEIVPRLVLVAEMLERIRSTLACPVIVTSGYRCPRLNAAVGGVTSSDHMQGHAADFVCPGFGSAHAIASTLAPLVSTLGIGQLILEGVNGRQWVHVSTHAPESPINRIITTTDAGTRAGIQEVA